MKYLVSGVCVLFLASGCATTDINDQVNDLSSIPKLPAGVITGIVTAGTVPAKGVDVELYAHCFDSPVLAKVYTGSKGEYRFKHLSHGKYAIGVNNFRGSKQTLPGFAGTCQEALILPKGEGLHYDTNMNRLPRKP